ncbi:MAG: general secretion pathway protein GspK [Thiohalocapsa sp.]|jgi:general secretion pathway protein K|uniref:general secretion pathway protein GspK n=1 Tax=Thiohalocapsa sp. TaxID=2497641 RepID=UPI0025E09760|nr:type II secretion system protein GspK [Thiohalocapsa sp.]MCG6941198.1 general secretion pathway protein GspK [Thiohalocapsa sp.]
MAAQRGIALVLVLWVITLLTVMALGLTTTQRTENALTRNQIDAARFRARAEAVLALTALNLLTTPLETVPAEAVWTPNGMPHPVMFDGADLTVTLSNEMSRLDLNLATRDQLAALIELAQGEEGFDEAQRDALADAIVDWRDEDDVSQLNGAEDSDYEAAGLPYGAADGPFRSVEELQLVLGMPRALYRRLAPDLTVHNDTGRVEQRFASARVLAAVQGIALEDAEQLVLERDQPLLPDGQQPVAVSRGGPLYRVRVAQVTPEGAGRQMEALLSVQGGQQPFEVLWRRYGLPAEAPQATGGHAADE